MKIRVHNQLRVPVTIPPLMSEHSEAWVPLRAIQPQRNIRVRRVRVEMLYCDASLL